MSTEDTLINNNDEGTKQRSASNQPQNKSTLQNFKFTGKGEEYFRIWIVNVLLSIVTLGIYSAWAKVRTQRYFYGNTYLGDSSFEYHANPIQILKGRLIAVFFLIIYIFAGQINQLFSALATLVLFALTPWIIVNSFRFNARVSSYRGIAFNFTGTIGQAAKVFILWPFLAVISLFTLIPYTSYRQTKFYVDGHRYGNSPFNFSAKLGMYYTATLIPLVFFIISLGLFIGAFLLLNSKPQPGLFILGYVFSLLAFFSYQIKTYNIFFNHLSIQSNAFSSKMKISKMLWIVFSNTVLVIITLGIFYPWAKVRTAKYKAEATQANLVDVDSFIASEQQQKSALGEEIGEAFDVGFDI